MHNNEIDNLFYSIAVYVKNFKITLFIALALFVSLCCCSKPFQKSATPSQPQLPDFKITTIVLECSQKHSNLLPFVELVLLLHNDNTSRYFIATVYGTMYATYTTPPPFAPSHAVCGITINHNTVCHYFFVCVISDTIIIQSTEKKCFDEPDSEHYHPIITIPWKHVNTIQTKVIINDRE